MTDPNGRCQVPNAASATVPLIPDNSCISDIAIDMADAMLPTAAELIPHSSARAEYRVGAWVLMWKLIWTSHGNRERGREDAYAQTSTATILEKP